MHLLVMHNYLHRFVDIDLCHPDSVNNYLAVATSLLCKFIKCEGIIYPRYCLYRINAFLSTLHMATPFKAMIQGLKDARNYFQFQLRINIERTFGILVSR